MKRRGIRRTWIVVALLWLGVISGVASGRAIYVKAGATGADSGNSWTDAYTSLQSALAAALDNDQIWVAAGTYRPTADTDRTVSFQMKNNVAIYGGFPAAGEPVWADRDWQNQVTILSGDIGTAGAVGDNSYTVVNCSNTNATAVLDGFVITGGYADQYDSGNATAASSGAGIYNDHGNPVIRNCRIRDNTACVGGGGMYNNYGSPYMEHCAFVNNQVYQGSGGAMVNWGNVPALIGCVFQNNSVSNNGGGLFNVMAQTRIFNCSFFGNSAPAEASSGGAIFDYFCSNASVVNTVFSGNTAQTYGGAVIAQLSTTSYINCTFSGNSAAQGGAVASYGESQSPAITNSILWNNPGGEIFVVAGPSPTITYSVVNGIGLGYGNLSVNPGFADPDGPDNLLGTTDDNLRLNSVSPAEDAGNNTAIPQDGYDLNGDGNIVEPIPYDNDGNPRFRDDPAKANTGYAGSTGLPVVDMGAYEWHHPCDLHVDGQIDLADLAVLAAHWLETDCGHCGGADLAGDGGVDLNDFAKFAACWGTAIP